MKRWQPNPRRGSPWNDICGRGGGREREREREMGGKGGGRERQRENPMEDGSEVTMECCLLLLLFSLPFGTHLSSHFSCLDLKCDSSSSSSSSWVRVVTGERWGQMESDEMGGRTKRKEGKAKCKRLEIINVCSNAGAGLAALACRWDAIQLATDCQIHRIRWWFATLSRRWNAIPS